MPDSHKAVLSWYEDNAAEVIYNEDGSVTFVFDEPGGVTSQTTISQKDFEAAGADPTLLV